MAAQQQVQFGVPNVPHFWAENNLAYSLIGTLYARGRHHTYEDIVCDAWVAICQTYFPRTAATPNGPRWNVARERYRAGASQSISSVRPDVLVIKLLPSPVLPGTAPAQASRDYVWIECKAAAKDTPSGWRDALTEAAARLGASHATRTIYMVIAIGYKCMTFVWDPTNTIVQQHHRLRISSTNGHHVWLLDPRIKGLLWASSYWNHLTGVIDVAKALELECWRITMSNGRPVLRNFAALSMIEQFLMAVQVSALPDLNPPEF